jgi:hypothetical protein
VLTEGQREFPDERCDEMSGQSDEVGTEAWKQVAESVRVRGETRECSSAEDAVREDAQHVRAGGVQVDRLLEAQREVVP